MNIISTATNYIYQASFILLLHGYVSSQNEEDMLPSQFVESLPDDSAYFDIIRRAAGFRYSGLGKRADDSAYFDILRRAAGFRYSGLGKRTDDSQLERPGRSTLDDEQPEIKLQLIPDAMLLNDKRSASFKYSGLGKRSDEDFYAGLLSDDLNSKRAMGFKYSGLGKRNGEQFRYAGLGKRGILENMYDDSKRAAAYRYTGLGKRTDQNADDVISFDDDVDKRAAGFKYSGLGKRMRTAYMLTGLGKRSLDYDAMLDEEKRNSFRYAGLGKRQAGFRYAGLGKRNMPSMRFSGLGNRFNVSFEDIDNHRSPEVEGVSSKYKQGVSQN